MNLVKARIMLDKNKQSLNTIFGFLLLLGLLYGTYKLLSLFWNAFSQVNPTLGAGVIAASATVIVSVMSVLVAKRLEYRALLQKEHREKKTPFYEEMVKFIFRIAFAEKLGLEPITEEQMMKQMASFTENLIIWGSDDVVNAWVSFRTKSVEGFGNSPHGILFEIENLLFAIRKDLGHANKGLSKGKILGTFVNDIHTIL